MSHKSHITDTDQASGTFSIIFHPLDILCNVLSFHVEVVDQEVCQVVPVPDMMTLISPDDYDNYQYLSLPLRSLAVAVLVVSEKFLPRHQPSEADNGPDLTKPGVNRPGVFTVGSEAVTGLV